ncbi:finTRIM family, member 86 [Thalassophryne amazonica]|uniref:finTRIM family, member 86 n=1 Tax=Thalassophryne amazonica TaxID=390379 RepID=UPI001471A882|nr:finTRIM family, member 86 [Thalassophryne amazonica]
MLCLVSDTKQRNLWLTIAQDCLPANLALLLFVISSMASAWSDENTFVCPVCLETLTDPATLPCGHSYCLACIQNHWDRGDAKGEYTCPQCRQVFNPRPPLAKSTVLVEAMEKLRTSSLRESRYTSASSAPTSVPAYLEVLPATKPVGACLRQGSLYPQLSPVPPRTCSQHSLPLDLFCHEDHECVCKMCCQHGHKGHHVVKPEEERRERQKELTQMQAEIKMRIEQTEKDVKELPPAVRQHKALVQALARESADLFLEFTRSVTATGTKVGELLGTYEASLGSRVESEIQRLEQEVAQLHSKNEELNGLTDIQDNIWFLKNFLTMEPLGQAVTTRGSALSQEEETVDTLRSAMMEFKDSLQGLCKASLDKISRLVDAGPVASVPSASTAADPSTQAAAQPTVCHMSSNPPPLTPQGNDAVALSSPQLPAQIQASAPPPPLPPLQAQACAAPTLTEMNPQPKTRQDLLKFRFEPTMDPNTVFRHMLLSDGDRKATLQAANLNPPDHPERFTFWRQALCREPLAGSPYYWEVAWTGRKISICVAYKEMERKSSDDRSRLGHNAESWSLYWSGTGFSFWHENKEKLLGSPKARRIGVYLDQHMGVLAFYCIANNQANLIYWHQADFTAPLYPGFRLWGDVGATVTICELD